MTDTDTDTTSSLLVEVATSWSPDQALAVVALLDSIASAIWHTHGDAMNHLIAKQGRSLIADRAWTIRAPPPVDDDLPF